MGYDPIARRARRDRESETERIGVVQPVRDAGEDRFPREELVAPRAAPGLHDLRVERARGPGPDEVDEVEAAHGADLGRPLLERQRRATVRRELLSPRSEDRAFGVEDETVEIE